MEGDGAAPLPEWGDLLDGLPDVGLLDDIQLDCGLGDADLPPGLDPLEGLDFGLDPSDAAIIGGTACGTASAGSYPASSDLLESLQLDAAVFGAPTSSSGAGHSPSGSGSDSPVVLPLMGGAAGPVPPLQQPSPAASPLRSTRNHASPATSESENNGQPRRPSPSGSHATAATTGAVPVPAGSPAPAGPAASAQHPHQSGQHMTDDEKRLARMQRNRENAQLSRQRKKQQMTELEGRCTLLTRQNAQLTGAVQRLTAENAALRQQLALVCAQTGRNAAAAAAAKPAAAGAPAAKPAAAGAAAKPAGGKAATQPPTPAAAAVAPPSRPGSATAPTTQSATTAAAAAVAARGLLPQWPLLPFAGFLPKVTLPQQQQAAAAARGAAAAQQQVAAAARAAAAAQRSGAAQQRTAAAAGAAPRPAAPAAAAPSAAAAAKRAPAAPPGASAPKRARTAAGASTAFLALFTLFMFAGPFTPAPLTTLPSASDSSTGVQHRALQALPESTAAASAAMAASTASSSSILDAGSGSGLHRTGRSLQALPAAASDASNGSLRPSQHPLLLDEAATTLEGAPGSRLQQLLNSTLQALLLEPGNAQLEAAALQRLQELGPVALLLDADSPGAAPGSNPLAASVAFPRLAEQLFGGAGLEVPQMCHKVLEFDAASVPHAVRSRRSLERFVLGSTGFRGRSLGSAALPAAGGDDAAQQQAERQQPQQGAERPTLRIEEAGPEGEEGPAGAAGSGLLPTGSAADGPVLVSILLPANASGGGNGSSSSSSSSSSKLAAVDKVFVVLLHPADKYVTYSCSLPRTVVL